MRCIALVLVTIICNSCFLISNLRKREISFSENGQSYTIRVAVPKKFVKSETSIDSAGNQLHYYFYPDGAVLYFAMLKDTSTELQPIDYNLNIPRQLYRAEYFKGIDSSHHYWRETRFGKFKSGYKNVNEENEGAFDSSLNYFSLHTPH